MSAAEDRSAADAPAARLVAATVHGRFLVRPPASGAARGWLVGFHGYAQRAEDQLDALKLVPGADEWLVVSVQALHPFYNRANDVVANWMTRQDREHAIADNIAYVDAVLDDLERDFGPPPALVFAGFSQGVAMAYRAGVCGRRRGDAVVAAGGDLPPELMRADLAPWPVVLICAGTRETYYTAPLIERDVAFLRDQGADVRTARFDGGHEWGAAVAEAAGALLASLPAR